MIWKWNYGILEMNHKMRTNSPGYHCYVYPTQGKWSLGPYNFCCRVDRPTQSVFEALTMITIFECKIYFMGTAPSSLLNLCRYRLLYPQRCKSFAIYKSRSLIIVIRTVSYYQQWDNTSQSAIYFDSLSYNRLSG